MAKQFEKRLCGCGCGKKFTPTRTWGQYATPKCRWEAWILKKAEEIKNLRRAAKVGATAALLLFVGGCSDLAHATVNMEAIKQIESGGNARAYNAGSGARGLYQITPICLKHYNRANGTRVGLNDLYKPEVNERVARWYFGWLADQGLDDANSIIAYNWGIGNFRRYERDLSVDLPVETRDYLTKYQAFVAEGGAK